MTNICNQIASMPKVELHLHLEGSLRAHTIFALAQRNGINLNYENPAELESLYDFRGFSDFAKLFRTGLSVLLTEQDFCDAIVALAKELAEQNVRYAEVTSTPFQHTSRGIPLEVYSAGINEGNARALDEYGVTIGWICDISRESESPESTETVDFLIGPSSPAGAIGLGLGGFETDFPPELFRKSFDKARANGLAAIPHAGEQVGADSIRQAVATLGAQRIGHGIRCIEDRALVDELVNSQIPLEVCLTSNVKLGFADSYKVHPFPTLVELGLLVTLNTDDPAYFGVTLTDELTTARDAFDLSVGDIVALQQTALNASFAPKEVRERIQQDLGKFAVSCNSKPNLNRWEQ